MDGASPSLDGQVLKTIRSVYFLQDDINDNDDSRNLVFEIECTSDQSLSAIQYEN